MSGALNLESNLWFEDPSGRNGPLRSSLSDFITPLHTLTPLNLAVSVKSSSFQPAEKLLYAGQGSTHWALPVHPVSSVSKLLCIDTVSWGSEPGAQPAWGKSLIFSCRSGGYPVNTVINPLNPILPQPFLNFIPRDPHFLYIKRSKVERKTIGYISRIFFIFSSFHNAI